MWICYRFGLFCNLETVRVCDFSLFLFTVFLMFLILHFDDNNNCGLFREVEILCVYVFPTCFVMIVIERVFECVVSVVCTMLSVMEIE